MPLLTCAVVRTRHLVALPLPSLLLGGARGRRILWLTIPARVKDGTLTVLGDANGSRMVMTEVLVIDMQIPNRKPKPQIPN